MTTERRFVFTVGQLTRYLRGLLSRDRALQDVWVRGEVTDLILHASGHAYFTLKDQHSQIRCVLFREDAEVLTFSPESGREMLAGGMVTIYEPRGQYQLVVRELEQAGLGDLHLAFERLRGRLTEEGLFDDSRKRALPPFPKKIALLTSRDGAAIHDLLTTIRFRWPAAHLVLIPTPVSGAKAAAGVVRSLCMLELVPGVEVAVLARGGGSMQELSGFNSEEVARAIAASPVPIVTGIGHETDVTIADFVADHRAPTPTAAAAAATPDRRQLMQAVRTFREQTARHMDRAVVRYRRELALLRARPVLSRPRSLLGEHRQRTDEIVASVREAAADRLDDLRHRAARATDRLRTLSPEAVLARGYSITQLPDGSVVRSAEQLAVGAAADLMLWRGAAEVEVRKLRKHRGSESRRTK
jgi:exodeoxyribonuclease VII large subunit